MKEVLAIAAGASLGAVCRWWVVVLRQRWLGAG